MKVTIVGTHGIPARYGGFETFAEQLAMACNKSGIEVTVINEKMNPAGPLPDGISVKSSFYNKRRNPLLFYKDSLKKAGETDIILVCGVGGGLYYPVRGKSRTRIVTCVDGLEHLRKRYKPWERLFIYWLQKRVAWRSHAVVADAEGIARYWKGRFPKATKRVKIIAYGAGEPVPSKDSILKECLVRPREYFLVVARLVPENNIQMIIEAFNSYIGSKKLVIVGPLDSSGYVRKLERMANEKVLFTDGNYEREFLDTLRRNCFLYIHGHSIGGTNPSLLEAMAAGCAVICHDNEFNREVTDKGQMYFKSKMDLAIMLNLLEHKAGDMQSLRERAVMRVRNEYSWEKICEQYIHLFNSLRTKSR